jgi:predicted acylesterase/phospholipase RssA
MNLYTNVMQTDILLGRSVPQTIAMSALFGSVKSIYDSSPLWQLLNSQLTAARVDTILNSQKQLFVTAVNLATAQTVYFYAGPDPIPVAPAGAPYAYARVTDKDSLTRAILASADEPVFTPPVEVIARGAPGGPYVDGGVRNVFPAKPVIDSGVTDLYGIILSPEDDDAPGKYENILTILGRTFGLFMDEIAAKDVAATQLYNDLVSHREMVTRRLSKAPFNLSSQKIDDLFTDPQTPDPLAGKGLTNLHIIRPAASLEKTYSTDGLRFEPAAMAAMMIEGQRRAREVLGAP